MKTTTKTKKPAHSRSKTTSTSPASKPAFSWAIPDELGVPTDPLRLRLDFHHQAITMTTYDGMVVDTKLVHAQDVSLALASELVFGSGILPEGALWWSSTSAGSVTALYVPPQVRKVALSVGIDKPARRFEIPMPPLVFLCIPGRPPWVYAVKQRPEKESDTVYKAPLANVYHDGHTCPGSHVYPTDIREMVKSFFLSFFSQGADLRDRSKKYPGNIVQMWMELDGKGKEYPLGDLVEYATIGDITNLKVHW